MKREKRGWEKEQGGEGGEKGKRTEREGSEEGK